MLLLTSSCEKRKNGTLKATVILAEQRKDRITISNVINLFVNKPEEVH